MHLFGGMIGWLLAAAVVLIPTFFCWPLRSDATAAFDFIACQKWFRWRSVALSGRANRLAFDARLADRLYDE